MQTIWDQAIDEWCRWLLAAGHAPGTRRLRRYHLSRFSREVGERSPWELTLDDIVGILARPGWSPETRRSARSSLTCFYRWAVAAGRVGHNPAALSPTVTVRAGTPRPAPENILRASVADADDRVRLMLRLAACEGLRRCEICKVHVDEVVQAVDGTWELTVVGKGDKRRQIPLLDDLARELQRVGAASPTGYVFPGQINGHLSAAYVGKLMSQALPTGWTAHTLRHRFASAAYAAERDIRAVQELLGHADVRTTQIYTAVPADAKRRAVLGAVA
ncbi:MAG: tyrosine-type recombinase/integrase [Gordonia sp. (in: high G+C Gram-positive bacteria)]